MKYRHHSNLCLLIYIGCGHICLKLFSRFSFESAFSFKSRRQLYWHLRYFVGIILRWTAYTFH